MRVLLSQSLWGKTHRTKALSQNRFPSPTLLVLSFERPVIKPDNNRKPSKTTRERCLQALEAAALLQDVDVRYYQWQDYLFHMLSLSLSLYVIYQLQTYVGNNLISVVVGHQRFLSASASYYICIPLSYTQWLEGVFI